MSLPDSFFVSPGVQARQVKLADGSSHTIHFKQLPAVDFLAVMDATDASTSEARNRGIAMLLVKGVCNADGSQAMTIDQAMKLRAGPMRSLYDALMEVNGVSDEAREKAGND
ncbi:hypothetical protein [Lysobacter antibioticus]|uniref:hypothetical protein n=1 Tax=Lysobacter antibioticus TaxID=84531 RepID=UPI0007E8C1DF|nr:hypothetical protein [Lysobacter antibioticus]